MDAQSDVREAMLAAVPNSTRLRDFPLRQCRPGERPRPGDAVAGLEPPRTRSSRAPTCPRWLFTILRNHFRSEFRKRKREVEDADGSYADSLTTPEEQTSHIEFTELREALLKLSPDQREALILIGASGFSYEEAAKICGCAVGTIKSRVNRARIRLAELHGHRRRTGLQPGRRNAGGGFVGARRLTGFSATAQVPRRVMYRNPVRPFSMLRTEMSEPGNETRYCCL